VRPVLINVVLGTLPQITVTWRQSAWNSRQRRVPNYLVPKNS